MLLLILYSSQSHGIAIVSAWVFFIGVLVTIEAPRLIQKDISAQTRLAVWSTAWKGIQERPWLGWGQENTAAVLRTTALPYLDAPYDRAHNILLDWGLSAGLIGVKMYLALFACAFYALWKQGGVESAVLASVLVAYFVQNLFAFDTLMSYVVFVSVLAYSGGKEHDIL